MLEHYLNNLITHTCQLNKDITEYFKRFAELNVSNLDIISLPKEHSVIHNDCINILLKNGLASQESSSILGKIPKVKITNKLNLSGKLFMSSVKKLTSNNDYEIY